MTVLHKFMQEINIIYIGNLFRSRKGLDVLDSFTALCAKRKDVKLTIYHKQMSWKAILGKITTFLIRTWAFFKIRKNSNIEIVKCGSHSEYFPHVKTCEIGLSLGDEKIDSKHRTRISEYINCNLNVLTSLDLLDCDKYKVEKTSDSLEIKVGSNYVIQGFETPYSFENSLLCMNEKELVEERGRNMLRINCTFTENFQPLFHDQKIYELYDVKFDFKIEGGVSSNTSIINADKYKDKNINYVLNKIKLYENVIYCLKIKHGKKVSVKIFENKDYTNPICRNTLTTEGVDSIHFKVPKTSDYEVEVLTWGMSGISFELFNYISPNHLCNGEVFVINLEEQKEKYAQTEFVLNKCGIKSKRFKAINGEDAQYDDIWNEYTAKDFTDLEKKLGRKALQSRGALGYLLSMEMLFEKAIKENWEYLCVLDDDIMLNKGYSLENISCKLVELSDFSVLRMGSSQWDWNDVTLKDGYYEANKLSNGSFFNIYHKDTFTEIYNTIRKYDSPFDGAPLQAFTDRKAYVLYPNYAAANLDDISSISRKKRSEDYQRFRWNKDDYEYRNNCIELMKKESKNQDKEKLHFLIGITTFKRYDYLSDCVDSILETLDKKYNFTLVVAIGYENNFNEAFYDRLFEKINKFPNISVAFYKNKLHYVYYNSNIVLKHAEREEFDLGFIVNDDILFEKNWFLKYYEVSKETKFSHLCYCIDNDNTKHQDKLKTNGNVFKSNGVLLTFDKEIIRKVGFFDEMNFKVRGQAHHDWSRRCCRLGFNDANDFFDMENSNEYIKLNDRDYKSTILSYESLDKMLNFVDSYELERRNQIMENPSRKYVDTIINLDAPMVNEGEAQ